MAIVIHIEAGNVMELDVAFERLKGMLADKRAPIAAEVVTEQEDDQNDDVDAVNRTPVAPVAPPPAAAPRKRRTKAEIDADNAGTGVKTTEVAPPPSPAPSKPPGDDPALTAPRDKLRGLMGDLMALGMTPDQVRAAFFTPLGVKIIPEMTVIQLAEAIASAEKLLKEKQASNAAAAFA